MAHQDEDRMIRSRVGFLGFFTLGRPAIAERADSGLAVVSWLAHPFGEDNELPPRDLPASSASGRDAFEYSVF